MAEKHTPGPWWIDPEDLHQDPDTVLTIAIRAGEPGDESSMVACVTAFSLHSEDVDGTTYVSPSDPGEEATGEAVANARLISAAPTMHAYIQARADAGDAEARNILELIYG